jgi:hypothetical protein
MLPWGMVASIRAQKHYLPTCCRKERKTNYTSRRRVEEHSLRGCCHGGINYTCILGLCTKPQETSIIIYKPMFSVFCMSMKVCLRSECRRGLRHELSSPAQSLGTWVRISLEAWMSVSLFRVHRLGSCDRPALPSK